MTSVPTQAGNSGSPLVNEAGQVVGLLIGSADHGAFLKWTGQRPQNVNFATKASVVRNFLDSHDVNYRTEFSERVLSAVDVADRAKQFTVLVECWR